MTACPDGSRGDRVPGRVRGVPRCGPGASGGGRRPEEGAYRDGDRPPDPERGVTSDGPLVRTAPLRGAV
ncbi:hypothetical protein GCM10010378_49560 [Streptomyces viridochromogenes]